MEAYGGLSDKTSGKSAVFRLFQRDELALLLSGEVIVEEFAWR